MIVNFSQKVEDTARIRGLGKMKKPNQKLLSSHVVFFRMKTKFIFGFVFATNIIWKCGDYIFLNEGDRELFVKKWRMDGLTDGGHFIIFHPGPTLWLDRNCDC